MKRNAALILVDLQNDFVPGGTLAVPDGAAVVALANRVQRGFDLVLATQDWHPRDHGSFAPNHRAKMPGEIVNLNGLRQILWPVHCVQNSHGAEFLPGLDMQRVKKIFRKGTDPWIDSYSAFFDNGRRKETGLGRYLKSRGVTDVYVLGLATDYCVKFTALDAVRLGFQVHLIEDGCRGVNLKPGDVAAAIDQMRRSGVEITRSSRIASTARTSGTRKASTRATSGTRTVSTRAASGSRAVSARSSAGRATASKTAVGRAKRKVAVTVKSISSRAARRRVPQS